MVVSNNLLSRILFAKFCYTECVDVMPFGFALIFVKCFIRLHLLEIIGIEPDGPLVRLLGWVVNSATRTYNLTS